MNFSTCIRCGMSFRRALALALLRDAGARTYPDSEHCESGKLHDFRHAEDKEPVQRRRECKVKLTDKRALDAMNKQLASHPRPKKRTLGSRRSAARRL